MPGRPLNIVLVCGFRIFPSFTGGHIRTLCLARALARMGHRVLIYSLAGRHEDYRLADVIRSRRMDDIEPNLREETNLGLVYGVAQILTRLLRLPRVWQYRLLRAGFIPRSLRKALRQADLIIGDMPWCPPIRGYRQRTWYLLSHNLEHRILEQGPPRLRRFAPWMKAIECAAPTNFQEILCCAEEDREFFRQHDTGRRLSLPLIRNGVDPLTYQASPGARERVRAQLGVDEADTLLVFSASDFAPNVEALKSLQAFCRAQADFLKKERVYIVAVGSVSPTAVRDGALICTGRVPEIVPYLAAADAGLNPIVRGSGSNVKLFEYLAARLPVISTIFGVRGIALESPRDYILYDPADPAQAVGQFVRGGSHADWRQRAEEVWIRHRHSCDMSELVRDAVRQLPPFTE